MFILKLQAIKHKIRTYACILTFSVLTQKLPPLLFLEGEKDRIEFQRVKIGRGEK